MKINVSLDNLQASICKDSFYEFLKYFWDAIITDPFTDNWHIEILCIELQKVAERVFKREPKEYDLIINVPPGSTKSTIASIMFPAWIWTRMPDARTICGSYSSDLSIDLAVKCRDVIRSDKYKRLFPYIMLREDMDAKSYFGNLRKGTRYSTSIGGSVTGMHGHFIIIDDPLNPKQSVSEDMLKTANDWMGGTLSTRKIDKAVTPTILIMQRLHQNDPTGDWLEKASQGKLNIRHICLPGEITDEVKPERLRRFYNDDGLLDPNRLSRPILDDLLANLLDNSYAGQVLQSPIAPGGAMFKVENLHIGEAPALNHFTKIIRYWDKAGTEKKTSCYTVGAKLGLDSEGRFWVLDIMRNKWESFTREKVIKATAEMDTRNIIVGVEQEPGSGGLESAQGTVKNLAGWIVIVDRPTGDKAKRADPFSVQVNGGNVWIQMAEWNRAYIDEMKFFPFSKFKDQIDASSGAFAYLTKAKKIVGGLSCLNKIAV